MKAETRQKTYLHHSIVASSDKAAELGYVQDAIDALSV